MVKFMQSIMKTFVLSLVFFGTWVVIVHVTKGWTGTDWLTAQDWDLLTAEKWNIMNTKLNDLNNNVNNLSNNINSWWWEEVNLSDTADFSTGCDRKVEQQNLFIWIVSLNEPTKLRLEMSWTNRFHINSNSKNTLRLQNDVTTRPITKIWKKCYN